MYEYIQKRHCLFCGAEMYVDDREERFKGNYDIYWNCTKCVSSCIEEYRFSQSYKEIWHSENGGKVVDKVVKKMINTSKQKR